MFEVIVEPLTDNWRVNTKRGKGNNMSNETVLGGDYLCPDCGERHGTALMSCKKYREKLKADNMSNEIDKARKMKDDYYRFMDSHRITNETINNIIDAYEKAITAQTESHEKQIDEKNKYIKELEKQIDECGLRRIG